MAYQSVFKRYELKFMLTREQKDKIQNAIAPYMALDAYGHTTIRNIYFDTDNYRLVRCSIERPVYKEKLRVRSYQKATSQSPVFVELKKKYQSVVFKRRISLPEETAMQWLCGHHPLPQETQISREIQYALSYYQTLHPVVFLSYERDAYYSLNGSAFRVTFDENILCRQEKLSLTEEPGGISLLNKDAVLMELKCPGSIPLWMTHILSEEGIYKTSYSKYGTAYQQIIYPKYKEVTHDPLIVSRAV